MRLEGLLILQSARRPVGREKVLYMKAHDRPALHCEDVELLRSDGYHGNSSLAGNFLLRALASLFEGDLQPSGLRDGETAAHMV